MYAAGGQLFCLAAGSLERPQPPAGWAVRVDLHSPRNGLDDYRVSALEHTTCIALHPEGLAVALAARGAALTLGLFHGPASQSGGAAATSCSRCRLLAYLSDKRLVAVVSDGVAGEDGLELHHEDQSADPQPLPFEVAELGTVHKLLPSPVEPLVALINHRMELLIVTVGDPAGSAETDPTQQGKGSGGGGGGRRRRRQKQVPEGFCRRRVGARPGLVRVDAAAHATETGGGVADLAWSPCGSWLAYSFAVSSYQRVIKLLDVRTGATTAVTAPVAEDTCPAFDPAGRYLYFISNRELEPAWDEHLQVGLSCRSKPATQCWQLPLVWSSD